MGVTQYGLVQQNKLGWHVYAGGAAGKAHSRNGFEGRRDDESIAGLIRSRHR